MPVLIWTRCVNTGGQYTDKGFRWLAMEGWQQGYAVINFTLIDIGPCPWAINGHRGFTFIKGCFCDGVISIGIDVLILNEIDNKL